MAPWTCARTPPIPTRTGPRFTARLSPDALRPGTLELVTRAYVEEASRTRKGKRKVNRRIIGGLLPIRSGETMGLNGPGDPVRVDVHAAAGRVHPAP